MTIPNELLEARAGLSQVIEPADTAGNILVHLWGPQRVLEIIRGSHPTQHEWQQLLRGVTEETTVGYRKDHFSKALHRWRQKISYLDPGKALNTSLRDGATLLVPEDPRWPQQLNDLGVEEPLALWCLGHPEHISLMRAVSLVGSREVTNYGNQVVRALVQKLNEVRLTTVSGGAYGIDALAHSYSLELGSTQEFSTVAVLAGGLDKLYPAGNSNLFRNIRHSGAIISEMPPGMRPNRYRFLHRNRVIAALSEATIVVEARYRSGAQSTAHHALRIERPVGVVPGSIFSPSSAGCHRLIRESPVQIIDDPDTLMTSLGLSTSVRTTPEESRVTDQLSEAQIVIFEALPVHKFTTPAKLLSITGLPLPTVLSTLQQLLLKGLVENAEGGWRKGSG